MSVRLLEIANDQDIILERFDHFEMKLVRCLTSSEAIEKTNSIVEALAELPSRDKFALTVGISGDDLTISDSSERGRVEEHISSHHEDGESIDFQIEVLKDVAQQRLSVYSLTAFADYLGRSPLSDALAALAKRFQERLIFECYSGSPGIGSATLNFVKFGDSISEHTTPLEWRGRALELLQDNAYRTGNTGTLLPQDFSVVQSIGVAPLDEFMARAGTALSIMFLSNVADIRGDQLSYRISGYKLLTGTVENVADLIEGGSFQKIASWACGAEGSSDKIGLARNVISLCVQHLKEVPAHPEIWDAIQSNYQIYLKENIATYLEVRNKLAELLVESTHKAHSLVEGLLDSIRNGVLVIMTFLLTVVVINGLKDTGVQVIFSREYLAIVLALLVLITLVTWASCVDARSRFDQSSGATKTLLKRMYAHVMMAKEIEDQVNPTISESLVYLNRQARKYFIAWIVFAAAVALLFILGNWFFSSEGRMFSGGALENNNASGTAGLSMQEQGAIVSGASVGSFNPLILQRSDSISSFYQYGARNVDSR